MPQAGAERSSALQCPILALVMPTSKRHYAPGDLQFLTSSTYRRAQLFESDRFRLWAAELRSAPARALQQLWSAGACSRFVKAAPRRRTPKRQVAHTLRSRRCVRSTNLRHSLRGVWATRDRVTRDDGGPLTTPSSGRGIQLSRGKGKGREQVTQDSFFNLADFPWEELRRTATSENGSCVTGQRPQAYHPLTGHAGKDPSPALLRRAPSPLGEGRTGAERIE